MLVFVVKKVDEDKFWCKDVGWVDNQEDATSYVAGNQTTDEWPSNESCIVALCFKVIVPPETTIECNGCVWSHDLDSGVWCCGTPHAGCGVYPNNHGEWMARVVVKHLVATLGPYTSREGAMRKAIGVLRAPQVQRSMRCES